MSKPQTCRWCGSELAGDHESRQANLCPECRETYENESHRSMHPAEERQPHND